MVRSKQEGSLRLDGGGGGDAAAGLVKASRERDTVSAREKVINFFPVF